MPLSISSPAFAHNGEIPRQYTCEGDDVSPPLVWEGAPPETQSFVLIVDDPDAPDPAAPERTWVHWVVYNIPPDAEGLSAAVAELPDGAVSGSNDWQKFGYGGPCPPSGRHRYFFKLYALDTWLPELGMPTKAELEDEIEGFVIAQAELVGTYQKHT